jgi:DNA-binding transcriptional ArsR family regulator
VERGRQTSHRLGAPTLDIRASAPCELVLHLSECSAPGVQASTTLGKAWFDRVREAVDPTLLAAIDAFTDPAPGAPVQLWSRLVPLAYATPPPHDVPTFLAHFRSLPPLQVRLALLGYDALPQHRVAPREAIFLAAQGEEAAIREVAAKHFPNDPGRREALGDLLLGDPAETRARLLAILERWYQEAFRPQEAELLPALERDARATRALGRSMPMEELVETVTNGIEFRPWPGLQWIALVPTYVMRPWTMQVFQEEGTIFCYPAADEHVAATDGSPPARLVRLHQALGDERRLRILRHLATQRATFQEIAGALDIPRSSLHYHLGILRSAGLLRVASGERGTVYSLRRESLSGMAEALLAYFETDRPQP